MAAFRAKSNAAGCCATGRTGPRPGRGRRLRRRAHCLADCQNHPKDEEGNHQIGPDRDELDLGPRQMIVGDQIVQPEFQEIYPTFIPHSGQNLIPL